MPREPIGLCGPPSPRTGSGPDSIPSPTRGARPGRADPLPLAISRDPSRPLFLAADLGDAGPSLRLLAYGHAVAERFPIGHDIIEMPVVGIDHDRARCLLAVELD